ncbi:tRNA (adenosine(37)-N6)-dimethylallyltransferase MiaA [Herbiconiux sp. L3-i23]|uniref:tRNA (adenosine(37)-N6)-dimethylallyltransferase MiaA n=1 Tax=Herbiconiux sp. L3-i23 TaxID=2905871 RepID=UPI00205923E1|nr:tRNA (adenosine(37)-N6)-dimethylallyltransferase MiaA [Herbiconiux sp. L3-i23]BDI22219.1 tRNA dimethylallyltransferase [Herbiconiux sp. L3-i23]
MTAPPLVVIGGPTGTGKSALSLELAETLRDRGLRAEVVNADAMQLYRGMDIGTAKLPIEERHGIPHHLLDVLEVTDLSTVAGYQELARAAVDDIRARGAVPLLVGGSGLYISALMHDFRFPGTDDVIRERLERELADRGSGAMWERLREADPTAALTIDPANGRRVIRALEVIEFTGEPYSATLPDEAPYRVPTIVTLLDVDPAERPVLKKRLAERARAMFDDGLLDEVEQLLPLGLAEGLTASRAIGYAQAIDVLAGRRTRADAIDDTTALTWRYVRRQRSWFGRYRDAHRIPVGDPAAAGRVLALLESRLET